VYFSLNSVKPDFLLSIFLFLSILLLLFLILAQNNRCETQEYLTWLVQTMDILSNAVQHSYTWTNLRNLGSHSSWSGTNHCAGILSCHVVWFKRKSFKDF